MQIEQTKDNVIANDQVYKETRWVSALIIPFLLVAFYILYLYPERSSELFAWAVYPRITAMLLASGYIAGAYFFSRAAVTSRWHWVERGFLPVIAFGILMALATILHPDAFNNNHLAFLAWSVLNLTVPFLVFAAWGHNRVTDPGLLEKKDVLIPDKLRVGFAVMGLMAIVISAMLFLHPELMAGIWPWQINPLTARVIAGLFVLPGVLWLAVANEPRWTAARIPLQAHILSLIFVVAAIIFAWNDLDKSRFTTWIFLTVTVFLFFAIPLVYQSMEKKRRKKNPSQLKIPAENSSQVNNKDTGEE
jgi:hypothetical protein